MRKQKTILSGQKCGAAAKGKSVSVQQKNKRGQGKIGPKGRLEE